MPIVFNQDAIADFRYDPATGRYRWRSGSGRGQFASLATVLARTKTYINEQQSELQSTGQSLIEGRISLEQFQRQSADIVKQIHLAQATLGKGGIHAMQPEDWLRVGRELKRHYYDGKTDTGRRYGLKHLAAEIKAGTVSDAQLLNRLGMYGDAGKVSYWDAWKSNRLGQWGIRVLGSLRPCNFCQTQAAIGPRKIETIPPCGCCPQCLSRCKCSIVEVDEPRGDSLLNNRFGWVA